MDTHLLIPLALIPAILLGQLGLRFGLPVVVGQILTGFILGPMVLGLIHGVSESGGNDTFQELAKIGLCVLLFKVGLETRLPDFLRIWRQALAASGVDMFLSLAAGFLLGWLFGWPPAAALFLGAALTPTSIGVTASVLEELNLVESKESCLILGAAVVDDVLGLLLLSILVAAGAGGGMASVVESSGLALISAVGFLVIAILAGPIIVKGMHWLTKCLRSEAITVVLAVSFFLLMADFAESAGLAAIIGSYAAGLAFSDREEQPLLAALRPLTEVFAPLFFVLVGSSVNLTSDVNFTWLLLLLLVTVVAVFSKATVPFILRSKSVNKLVVGCGLIPRGEVGLIFAQVGIATGSLNTSQYSLLVLVLIATTIIGPILLRRTMSLSTT